MERYPDKWIALRDRVLRRFAMIDEKELVGVMASYKMALVQRRRGAGI